MDTAQTIVKRYRLKRNERNVSNEGHALVEEHRRTHHGQIWNGITHELLYRKYGDAMRHVPGYGWVLTIAKTVEYSDYVDRTVNLTVKAAIERSAFKAQFQSVLDRVLAKTSDHEQVKVSFWYSPFVYIDVKDDRWQHSPCGHRLLLSFDLTNGLVASPSSTNQYAFARKGWGPFADKVVGARVRRFGDCGSPSKTDRC